MGITAPLQEIDWIGIWWRKADGMTRAKPRASDNAWRPHIRRANIPLAGCRDVDAEIDAPAARLEHRASSEARSLNLSGRTNSGWAGHF